MAGASVLIGARNMRRGDAVAADIRQSTQNPAVEALRLDLSDLSSVRAFAAAVRTKTRVVHYLINNAGIADVPFMLSAGGHELQFATNHLGHFLLFSLLVDRLRDAAGARVVALTSAAHRHAGIDFDDIHFRRRSYDAYTAYAQSKTATALFAVALSRRFLAEGISCNSVMPGMVVTDLIGTASPERLRQLRFTDEDGRLQPYVKSIEQGAATSLWAALSPDLDGIGGVYLEDCAPAKPWSKALAAQHPWAGFVPHAVAPDAAEQLWTESVAMVGD